MRPPPTLLASFKEVLSRTAVTESRGGASKLIRQPLKFQRPVHHHVQNGTGARHASSAAHPHSWRAAVESFAESIYSGTFNAIRSSAIVRQGPYSSSRLGARSSPISRPAARPLSSAARARFGPSPRPHPGHSTPRTAHVGLGTARTFSSSGFAVFDNVVTNAPLALRALAGQLDDGIDRRKWRADTAAIRRAARTHEKGKGKAPLGFDALQDRKAEFARFFGAASGFVAAHDEEAFEPVTLVLAVDPDLDLAAPSTSSSSTYDEDPTSFRVLSASALDSFASITSAYSTHAHHLRVVINRLSAAGFLDPEVHASTAVGIAPAGSEHAGRRIWRITFGDQGITRSLIERVVRGEPDLATTSPGCATTASATPAWAEKVRRWSQQSAVIAGQGAWWWLVGGEPASAASPELSSSLSALEDDHLPSLPRSPASRFASSASTSSATSEDGSASAAAFLLDAANALAVAETFVLPDPSASSLSLAMSTISSSSSVDESEVGDEQAAPWLTWTYDSIATSSRSTGSLLDVDVDGAADDIAFDPAASVWADDSEVDAVSFWESDTNRGLASREEDQDVRRFLHEVETAQGVRYGDMW